VAVSGQLKKIGSILYQKFQESPITIILFVLVVGYVVSKRLPQFLSEQEFIGQEASDFFVSNLNGEQVHLADLKGKKVVLNFWATWCGPCRIEIPVLNEIYSSIDQGKVEFLAVTTEEPQTVLSFVSSTPIKYPILIDNRELVTSLYKVIGYPTFVFIDENGIITDIDTGMNVFLKWKLRYFASGELF